MVRCSRALLWKLTRVGRIWTVAATHRTLSVRRNYVPSLYSDSKKKLFPALHRGGFIQDICLRVKYLLYQILIKRESSRQILEKSSISNFTAIRPVGRDLFHAETNGQTRSNQKTFFAVLRKRLKICIQACDMLTSKSLQRNTVYFILLNRLLCESVYNETT